MKRHADAMETARLQSEGTIESLREKLNALQEVICRFIIPSIRLFQKHTLHLISMVLLINNIWFFNLFDINQHF
jgi:hypothetical protein